MAEVILALDLPSGREALGLLDQLEGVSWVKIGSVLFTREGPGLVRTLRMRGHQVFLDLKWHDIPNTVAEAVAAALDLDVGLATVHSLGGPAMMEAAARAAAGRIRLTGVTVLTSHDDTSLARTLGRPDAKADAEVLRLARLAMEAGLDGVVCSPLEVRALRQGFANALLVVPGIRQPGDGPGDQARTATPAQAAGDGASYLVVGRPVTQAASPARAFRAIREAIG